jgi:tRNA (cytidine32/uridine32-2'-O)-methyltransferase
LKILTMNRMTNNRRIPFSKTFEKISKNVFYILVEPESYGNVGAAARALKTCGFYNLILVNPKIDHSQPEALWVAHKSEDILHDTQTTQSFTSAISDKKLVIGTTQRKRHFKFPLYSPEEIALKIEQLAIEHPVALVFGRERTGPTNAEILQCHLHSTIQTATFKPSLNLAQSVMIYAHTFFRMHNVKDNRYTYDLASKEELEKFYEHLQGSLKQVGFVPRDSMDDFITRFKRLIGRSMAEKRDVRLLHKLIQIFEKRIEQLEKSVIKENQSNEHIY